MSTYYILNFDTILFVIYWVTRIMISELIKWASISLNIIFYLWVYMGTCYFKYNTNMVVSCGFFPLFVMQVKKKSLIFYNYMRETNVFLKMLVELEVTAIVASCVLLSFLRKMCYWLKMTNIWVTMLLQFNDNIWRFNDDIWELIHIHISGLPQVFELDRHYSRITFVNKTV